MAVEFLSPRAARVLAVVALRRDRDLAAEELELGRRTVDRDLAECERWLGVPLFTGGGDALELTAEGRIAASRAMRAVAALDGALQTIGAARAPTATLNVVEAPSGIARWPLAAARQALERRGGRLRVYARETASEALSLLAAGTVEVAIVAEPPMPVEVPDVSWHEIPLVAVLPADGAVVGRTGPHVRLGELRAIELVLPRRGTALRAAIERTAGEPLEPSVEEDGLRDAITLVASGAGVTVIPASALVASADPRLTIRPLAGEDAMLRVAVAASDRADRAALARVRDELAQIARA